LKIKEINTTTYQLFYDNHKSLFNVFATSEWITIYNERLLLHGIYNDNDEIIGSFFLYKEKRKNIQYITNPPYAPHIGLTYINPAEKLHQKYTFTKKILELLANYLDEICRTFVYIALSPSMIDSQPFTWNGFNAVPNYTYQSDLKLSEEQILEALSPKKRNAFKKAIKDGLEVKELKDLKILENLITQTFQRKNKSIDLQLIDKILFQYANADNSFSFCTYQNNIAIAATFCIYFNHTCYYLLSGYHTEKKHAGAGILAVIESMKHAKQLNLVLFDFEGSMLPEIEEYFREFGGKLTAYNTINKAYGIYKRPMRLFKSNQF
jgi:lipid II:glycine glycyltransferase (peptidoglycan interpeptide bridge formation enzyme)